MNAVTLTPVGDPELWQPGDVKEIPTVLGLSYSCTITRVLPSVIEFTGPTGRGCITRELYAELTGATS